jgi:hypothetical protein
MIGALNFTFTYISDSAPFCLLSYGGLLVFIYRRRCMGCLTPWVFISDVMCPMMLSNISFIEFPEIIELVSDFTL